VRPCELPHVFRLVAPARERLCEVVDRAGFLTCGFNPRPNLPSLYGQWSLSASVPLTVTASCRIFTGFPFNRPCGSCPVARLRSTAGPAPDFQKIIPLPRGIVKRNISETGKKLSPPGAPVMVGRFCTEFAPAPMPESRSGCDKESWLVLACVNPNNDFCLVVAGADLGFPHWEPSSVWDNIMRTNAS